MFVRKKRNSSGSISIQIIRKIGRKNKVVETIGCSKDKKEIEQLFELAKKRIQELEPNLFSVVDQEEEKLQLLPISNDQVIPVGDGLFFGKLFDKLGLDNIFQDKKDIRYKEGKLARPQIQLGLFTTVEGYPLSYEVYDGKKYEGHTLLEALENFQIKFKLKHKPIVVADRGMLNDANITYLKKMVINTFLVQK